jgi:DNA-binding response OmpR family regulator
VIEHSSRHILVADDDPDIRQYLAMALEMSDFEVTLASNGDEAERLARELSPAAMLLDVMMPDRDGFDVLTSLKADERTRDIPIIMVTAKASDEDTWTGWSSGAAYYVTKPFDLDSLIDFLESLLASRTPVAQ